MLPAYHVICADTCVVLQWREEVGVQGVSPRLRQEAEVAEAHGGPLARHATQVPPLRPRVQMVGGDVLGL